MNGNNRVHVLFYFLSGLILFVNRNSKVVRTDILNT